MSDFQTGRSMANVRQIEAIEKHFRDRDAAWWDVIRPILEKGPQLSRDLIIALGPKNYNAGATMSAWLRKIERGGLIVRTGSRRGPTGHPNVLWALAPAA